MPLKRIQERTSSTILVEAMTGAEHPHVDHLKILEANGRGTCSAPGIRKNPRFQPRHGARHGGDRPTTKNGVATLVRPAERPSFRSFSGGQWTASWSLLMTFSSCKERITIKRSFLGHSSSFGRRWSRFLAWVPIKTKR